MFLQLCVVFRTAFYSRARASALNRSTIRAGAISNQESNSSFNVLIIQWTEGKLTLTLFIVRAYRGKQRCLRLDKILSHTKYKYSLTNRQIPADISSISLIVSLFLQTSGVLFLCGLAQRYVMLDMQNICNFVCIIRNVLLERTFLITY